MGWQQEVLLSAALTESNHYLTDKIPLAIRDQYPELAGVFDRFDDMTSEIEDATDADDHREVVAHRDKLAENMDDMSARCAQMRDMVLTLMRFDAANPIMKELAQLEVKLDDAHCWAEANK
jgi:Fe-S-cluster formation regulator IscX/YfhJ